MDNWYYSLFGSEFGPVSFETLCELAQTGQLAPDDLMKQGQDADWVAAGSIVGLFKDEPVDADPRALIHAAGAGSADEIDDPDIVRDFSDMDIKLIDSRTPIPTNRAPQYANSHVTASAPTANIRAEARPVPHRSTAAPESDREFDIDESLMKRTASTTSTRLTGTKAPSAARQVPSNPSGEHSFPPGRQNAGAYAAPPPTPDSPPLAARGIGMPGAQNRSAAAFPATPPMTSQPPLPPGFNPAQFAPAAIAPASVAAPPWNSVAGPMTAGPAPLFPPPVQVVVVSQAAPAPAHDRRASETPASDSPPAEGEEFLDEVLGVWDEEDDDDLPRSQRRKKALEDRWYCQIDGEEHGPIPFRQLKLTASAGRLTRGDLVRKGADGEWVPASAIRALFKVEDSRSKIDFDKIASSEGPVGVPSTPEPAPQSEAARPSAQIDTLIRGARLNAVAAPRSQAADKSDPAQLLRNPKVWMACGALLVGVMVWSVVKSQVQTAAERRWHTEFASVYENMQDLRKRKASQLEWLKLSKDANERVAPIMKEISSRTVRPETATNELMLAGSHILPMIGDSQKAEGPHERQFAARLKRAEAYLAGQPPPGMPPDDTPKVND